jgi:4-diphosphocytidyl-2C-methyl-D-erythritol kinase
MAKHILETIDVRENNGNHDLVMEFTLISDNDTVLMKKEYSSIVKGHVDGVTEDELIKRATDRIQKDIQSDIDMFVTKQRILKKIDSVKMSTSIDSSKVLSVEVKP